jgi:hypothetical protein
VDVDLVASDEVEEKVERALEDGKLDPGRVLGQGGLHVRGQGNALRVRGLVAHVST